MSIELDKITIKTALTSCLGRDFLAFEGSEDFVADLSAHAEEVRVQTGDYLFKEDDPVKHGYISISGSFMLERATSEGTRHIFAFVFTGSLLGFSEQHHFTFSAKALSESAAIKVNMTFIEELFDKYPEIAKRVHNKTNKILSMILDQLFVLGQKTAHQRIAIFLLGMLKQIGNQQNTFLLTMARRDVADYVGMSIETCSRGLSKLSKQGIISIKDNYIVTVLDEERLVEFASK